MTLLERLLRQLAKRALRGSSYAHPPRAGRDPPDFPWTALEVVQVSRTPEVGDELVLHLDAATIFDPRILATMMSATGPARLARSSAAAVIGRGTSSTIDPEKLPTYIAKLRRYQTPYVYEIRSRRDLEHAQRAMFDAVYKGVTDVVTSMSIRASSARSPAGSRRRASRRTR